MMGFLMGDKQSFQLEMTWTISIYWVKASAVVWLFLFLVAFDHQTLMFKTRLQRYAWRQKLEFISVLVMRCRSVRMHWKLLIWFNHIPDFIYHSRATNCASSPQLNSIQFDSEMIRLREKMAVIFLNEPIRNTRFWLNWLITTNQVSNFFISLFSIRWLATRVARMAYIESSFAISIK